MSTRQRAAVFRRGCCSETLLQPASFDHKVIRSQPASPVHIYHLLFVSSRAREARDRRLVAECSNLGTGFGELFLYFSHAWHLVSLATAHGFANLLPWKTFPSRFDQYCSMMQNVYNVYEALEKLSRSLLRPHLLSSGARGSRTNRCKGVCDQHSMQKP